jgi:hypothetical protein
LRGAKIAETEKMQQWEAEEIGDEKEGGGACSFGD